MLGGNKFCLGGNLFAPRCGGGGNSFCPQTQSRNGFEQSNHLLPLKAGSLPEGSQLQRLSVAREGGARHSRTCCLSSSMKVLPKPASTFPHTVPPCKGRSHSWAQKTNACGQSARSSEPFRLSSTAKVSNGHPLITIQSDGSVNARLAYASRGATRTGTLRI